MASDGGVAPLAARRATGTRASASGYVVALIGTVGVVVGCFLPYIGDPSPLPAAAQRSPSIYQLSTRSSSGLEDIGWTVQLFAGAVALLWLSFVGLRRPRPWTRPALVSVAIVWGLTWLGTLVGGRSFVGDAGVGYWAMAISIVAVVIGACIVWASGRPTGEGDLVER